MLDSGQSFIGTLCFCWEHVICVVMLQPSTVLQCLTYVSYVTVLTSINDFSWVLYIPFNGCFFSKQQVLYSSAALLPNTSRQGGKMVLCCSMRGCELTKSDWFLFKCHSLVAVLLYCFSEGHIDKTPDTEWPQVESCNDKNAFTQSWKEPGKKCIYSRYVIIVIEIDTAETTVTIEQHRSQPKHWV